MGNLKSFFGPSREEIWRQLSTELEGCFVPGDSGKPGIFQAKHDGWSVTLDTYILGAGSVYIPVTRIRAPFVNPHGFRFSVVRSGILAGLAKWLGLQDIQIGEAAFDDDFIIKGNDEARVRELLSNPRIRHLIDQQPDIYFAVQDYDQGWFGPQVPVGTDELHFHVNGTIVKDIARLTLLYELFAETLDWLHDIGIADKASPDLRN